MAIDWSKPENLRLRDWGVKILEVVVPKHPKLLLLKYPVHVFVEDSDGDVSYETYTMDGKYVVDSSEKHEKDIVSTQMVPLDFWEIVKLIQENKELVVNDNELVSYISEISIKNKTFRIGAFDYKVEQLHSEFVYSIDNKKTWHKFEKLED